MPDNIKFNALTELIALKDSSFNFNNASFENYLENEKYGRSITTILVPILEAKYGVPLNDLHVKSLDTFALNRVKLGSEQVANVLKKDSFLMIG